MVNLRALEAAIQKVEDVRKYEFEFEANGLRVVLKALLPEEELIVQQHSQVAYEGGVEESGQAGFSDYLDRMRTQILGFSIIELGDISFRDVEFFETEERDDMGNQVSLPKHEAVRDVILNNWSRTMLTHVFSKYGELRRRIDAHAEKSIEFDPEDLDFEIERLEKRIAELRNEKEVQEGGVQQDALADQQDAAVEISDTARQVMQGGPPDMESSAPPPDMEPSPPPPQTAREPRATEAPPRPEPRRTPEGVRQRAVPRNVPAGGREFELESESEPERPGPGPDGPHPTADSHGIPDPYKGDSFFDPADPEGDAAVAAESERQAALYREHLERQAERSEMEKQRRELGIEGRQAQRPPQETPQATDLSTRAPAPSPGGLRQAVNTSDQVFDSGAGDIQTGRPKRPTPAEVEGTPVFKMPTQTLDKPQHKRDGRGNIVRQGPAQGMPAEQAGGSRNPRFKGPPR